MSVCKALVDGIVGLDAAWDARGHHHCAGLSVQLLLSDDLLMEVIHHHGSLLGDDIRIPLDKGTQFFLGALFVEHRIVLDLLGNLVPAVNRRIVFQDVKDEAFLNGLLHGVNMERPVLDFAILFIWRSENLLGLVLWRRGERKIARGLYELPALDNGIDLVFIVHFVV